MIQNQLAAFVASAAILTLASCANKQSTYTYTPNQLRSMVQSGNYPRQGSPETKSESLGYSACVTRVEGIVASVRPNYPTATVVNTRIMRIEKVWTNDAAMTLTCSATDGRLVITSAPYQ